MKSKGELAEIIMINMAGGDVSIATKIDERDIFILLDLCISQFMNKMLRENREEVLNGSWIKTFTKVPVQFDCDRDECYCLLPSSVIDLYNDTGIRQVSYMKGQTAGFVMMKPDSQSVWNELEAGDTGSLQLFYPEDNKLFFPNMGQEAENDKLMIKMVAGSDGYGINEPVPLPSDYEATIVQTVMGMYVTQMQHNNKVINNGNANS